MKRIVIALSLMSIISCYNTLPADLKGEVVESVENDEVIPVDVALQTLEEFMRDNTLSQTRSGTIRTVASIDKYYRKTRRTRSNASDNDISSSDPVAYVVNFDDQQGFAVLGANRNLPDIVAVVENGSIDPITLNVNNGVEEHVEEMPSLFDEMEEDEIAEFNKHVSITEDSLFYSIEDEDYFDALYNGKPDSFASILIEQALEGTEYFEGSFNSDYTPDPGNSDSGSTSVVGEKYATQLPLLTINWDQNSPYNHYCKRGKNKDKNALAGCSSTALAMILAYNEYPNLWVNGWNIDWTELKKFPKIDSLDAGYQDQVKLLLGSIYSKVKKYTTESFTLITPRQIAIRLDSLGYENVARVASSELDPSMLHEISEMLSNKKPVFMSAIPRWRWKSGHSWVIDGAKYSSGGTYLLHMNLGWEGLSNGYYAIHCLNPAKAYEYDDPNSLADKYDYDYTWHFRIITYDKPTLKAKKSIFF